MAVEVSTVEELETILHNLWPGSRAELSKKTYATLFANREPNPDLLSMIYEFARSVGCSVIDDPSTGIVRFEKWHSPYAA